MATGPSEIQARLRARIDSLSYLPASVAVAMAFMEMAKDPEAGPDDYAKVIGADPALSAKLLSLTNSSWFGVRNEVTTVRGTIGLLGLSSTRTLTISYCLAGLHNELRIAPDVAHGLWEAALCKGVAAREYARLVEPKVADECFAAGIFQDMALAVMYATAGNDMQAILNDRSLHVQARLTRERVTLGLDHAAAGRMLAQKLNLPECLVDAVAFHHDQASLRELVGTSVIADGCYVASFFPHATEGWNKQDAEDLCAFLADRASMTGVCAADFIGRVQGELDELHRYFDRGTDRDGQLAQLMQDAAAEAADQTAHLVATVEQLLEQAAETGMEVHKLHQRATVLEDRVDRDALTGLLNRGGLKRRARELLSLAKRYDAPLGVVYIDLDRFKCINDTWGHDVGDEALKAAAERMEHEVRQHDLVGRVGGDEFVVLLYDTTEAQAKECAERIVAGLAQERVGRDDGPRLAASAGCLWLPPHSGQSSLDTLLSVADRLMYESKQAGGGRVSCQTGYT